ncbi:MAG: SUMF1/EgtB/PvdO family nonheme iron enzyme [Pseudomonadota bacterium]
MMSARTIFISYRRSDSQWAASRLFDTLAQAFPNDQLFMDVDSIDPGQDFITVLEDKIAQCDVFLALIGPRWLTDSLIEGQRRIDDPEDFVRIEIGRALARDETVTIPILLDGAEVPQEGELPDSLRPLARRQFVRLSHEGYRTEVSRLVAAISKAFERSQAAPPTSVDSTRKNMIPRRPSRFILVAVLATIATCLSLAGLYFAANQVEDFKDRADLSTIKECDECPELVVVPSGTFVMGSPKDEANRRPQEGPQRGVRIDRFALAKTELTFDAWDACIEDGGCGAYSAPDSGVGRGDIPAFNLSWEDAASYIEWLNTKVSGTPYRFPSESEWEYAARAGSVTPYYWGSDPDRAHANMGREVCCIGSAEEFDRWVGVAPVGQFPPNAFGLYDMAGNLSEWVADIYRSSYNKAPEDGSAWIEDSISGWEERRVLRGGSFKDRPWQVRSAQRFSNARNWRLEIYGFRPARDLTAE